MEEEDRGETGRGRRGGRRDTEAEIGDGPGSQTVSGLLALHAFSVFHWFVWRQPVFWTDGLPSASRLADGLFIFEALGFGGAQWELRPPCEPIRTCTLKSNLASEY